MSCPARGPPGVLVSLSASGRAPRCQGGSRSLAPGPLIASPCRSTRRRVLSLRSSRGAKVMLFPILPAWLLSFPGDRLPLSMCPLWPCSSAHTRMELLGKAQLLLNLLARCLQLELRACRLWGTGTSATPWGSMGPGSGPAAGCCVGKRVTVTTDRVVKRQNAIANRLLPRSFLQSQDAMSPAVAGAAPGRTQPARQLIPPARPAPGPVDLGAALDAGSGPRGHSSLAANSGAGVRGGMLCG